ncbi:MAG: holdfast anchoring protein HfaB [Caulobacteraceae bacterium]|nr:holdfast anchoring protein HfaB [Caulobacteraceae bacterium]
MAASFSRRSPLLRVKVPALLTACAMSVSACVSPVAGPNGRYAEPIGDAPVTANPTPYSQALVCLGQYARANHRLSPRIAVGRISDYTGKEESDGSGRKLTQGASLMAISALAKAGANLVERYDTSVSELELKYANNKLITDGVPAGPNAPTDYRKIMAGQVSGSDYYLVGGITELNFNIRSSGLDAQGGNLKSTKAGELTGELFVMNVGLDLRLVDTRTLQVVDVISYQKQIIGRQVGIGLFDVMGGNVYNVSAGEGALEPIQMAVRAVIERAVLEMMANLYGAPGPDICLGGGDPLNGRGTTGLTGGYIPAYNNLDGNNAQTRQDIDRWKHLGGPDAPADDRSRY